MFLMNIAIIGAGFAGLATAWHLIHSYKHQVTVFDPAGLGGGASGMAAGLLHPYANAHAKLNWRGKEGMEATLKLIDISSKAAEEPVAHHTGLLRPAILEAQEVDFALSASKNSEVEWFTSAECQKLVSGLVPKPGVFISTAWTVDCKKYLEGLWKACPGATLKLQKIENLQELASFDAVVIAMGIASTQLADVKLTPIKGQLLELEWPTEPSAASFSSKLTGLYRDESRQKKLHHRFYF